MAGSERDGFPTGTDERQLGRSAVAVLVLAAVTALVGPLLTYRSDVAELRTLLRSRVARDVNLYADALARHVQLLQAELSRLADHPDMILSDGGLSQREQSLITAAHRDSALFASGVAFLSADGRVVWSEPRDLPELGNKPVNSAWLERALTTRAPVADILEGSRSTLVVAVPVVRKDVPVGILIGMLEAPLPAPSTVGDAGLALFDADRHSILPGDGPAWSRLPDLPDQTDRRLREPMGQSFLAQGDEHFAAASLVGSTGLKLLLVVPEDRLLGPMRERFLLQLLLVSAVQLGAVLIVWVFIRRSFKLYLSMERRTTRSEKLAALGTASSLIAHEVKNSLNGLNAATSLLAQGADPALPVAALKGQVDRLRHLAASLLQFAGPSDVRLAKTDLPQLVSQTIEGLKVLPEATDVALSVELGPPVVVACDPLLMATAVDNLVRNAIEAAAAAKDLGRVASPRVAVHLRREGSTFLVTVEDNAGGPPAELEGRMFEPFVTGKPKGIGLGLAMAQQAIEKQHGVLGYERTPLGSRFSIRIQGAP